MRALFVSMALLATLGRPLAAAEIRPPNVLIIIADDLGFSDLGCYGGEIETPNLDRLAHEGLLFTQFYNTARCWPTRGALLTGYYAQQIRRDAFPGTKAGERPRWARLLPELLKPSGYRSYHSGKWHVDGTPLAGGFDHSYNLEDHGRYFNPKRHSEDDKRLLPIELHHHYYTTTAIAEHAIGCLRNHAANHGEAPFFSYVAFTAPHFPLHALPEDIARYRDRYQPGWDVIRQQRFSRVNWMGIVSGRLSEVERDVGPPYDFPQALERLGPGEVNRPLPWNSLTQEQQEFQATKMAIHAAMVDRMDREIGRILDVLRGTPAFHNTLICFLSDNGASAEIMVRDDGHDPGAAPGSAASYLCLGPGWSTAANTPFRRHKTWTHEGGIATPLIVHWPFGFEARGVSRQTPGHVIDLVPTILEVTRAERHYTRLHAPGPPLPGKSLVPAFANDVTIDREYLWWLHERNRAIRVGDFKLVAAGAEADWELYNLKRDRTETRNLAAEQPDKAAELARAWQEHCDEFRAQAEQ